MIGNLERVAKCFYEPASCVKPDGPFFSRNLLGMFCYTRANVEPMSHFLARKLIRIVNTFQKTGLKEMKKINVFIRSWLEGREGSGGRNVRESFFRYLTRGCFLMCQYKESRAELMNPRWWHLLNSQFRMLEKPLSKHSRRYELVTQVVKKKSTCYSSSTSISRGLSEANRLRCVQNKLFAMPRWVIHGKHWLWPSWKTTSRCIGKTNEESWLSQHFVNHSHLPT